MPKQKIARDTDAQYCRWVFDQRFQKHYQNFDMWETDCGCWHSMIDGTPKDNLMSFCPYCGRELKEESCL